MGAGIVLIYCFAGGIRASIWTDAVQSFLMIFSMGLLCFISVQELGGVSHFAHKMTTVSSTYTSLFPQDLPFSGFIGPLLFVLGWIFGGIGVVGQPHIMVRFMTMEKPENMGTVRAYYYSFYTAFYLLTILVGLAARMLLPNGTNFDAELALPTMATTFLPEILVGLILAGLFAATMSTADSQILSCTAALTHDFNEEKTPSYLVTKLVTVFVTAVALIIALYGSQNVFNLVLIAWSTLGASFGPLLFLYVFGGRPSEKLAILISFSGLATVIAWKFLGWDRYIYEIAPGMLMGFVVFFFSRIFLKSEE